MTKRTRTFAFLLLAVIFVLLAPALLLYSQGYRIDWDNGRLTQVGAFYLSVTPMRAEVFIDEQSIGKTAYVLGTTLTKNFSPGAYHVRIQKEGYHSWEKRLEIAPQQVTEVKRVVLLPLEPDFEALQGSIFAFWFAPNATEVLLQKSNAQNGWSLVLRDTQRSLEYALYETPRSTDELSDIEWNSDSESFSFSLESGGTVRRYVQRIDRNLLAGQRTAAESLRAAAQLRGAYIPHPLAEEATAFLEKGREVFWLDQNGFLWQKPSQNSRATQLNEGPLPVEDNIPYAIFAYGDEFFIQGGEALYRYDSQTRAFEQFFASFQKMVQSPDGRALALSSKNEIWLYFLREDREQPFRAKGEKVFLTRFSEDIANLAWLGPRHLLFTRGDTITVSEIDTRDRLNIVDLASFPNPTLFWQDTTKTLFVHTDDRVLASQNLLP